MQKPRPLLVSVMIVTRNRLEELQRTCRVLKSLDPPPDEILITADGCSDGTVEFLSETYPCCRLTVNPRCRGSVASRAAMMQSTSSDLVLALDDDSYPEERDCVATLRQLFDKDPNLAIATFPQRTNEYSKSLNQIDFGDERPVSSFASSGACLRVATYRSLPGFEPRFFHMYEEPDYALQCVAAGYKVLFTPVMTIRHHFSRQMRNEIRNHHLHSRNEIWSVLLRCPFPYATGVAIYRALSQFWYACRRGVRWAIREPAWWWQAMTGIPYCLTKRQPVSWASYKRWLRLP